MSDASQSLLHLKRDAYYAGLIAGGTLTVSDIGVASMADKSSTLSCNIARDIAQSLKVNSARQRAAGQTLGGTFETATQLYLEQTFPAFSMLRPGDWRIQKVSNRSPIIPQFEPYSHLATLAEAVRQSPALAAVLGNGYTITPDIVITRVPESDAVINSFGLLVDDDVAQHSAIRASNQLPPILHAVVSCKWTLRSDRAQNARSEALNLIRNRKGRLPHIVVVTAEPLPARLASLALGTGDIDCVYHIALPELQQAVAAHGNEDTIESLQTMVSGRRLKDIPTCHSISRSSHSSKCEARSGSVGPHSTLSLIRSAGIDSKSVAAVVAGDGNSWTISRSSSFRLVAIEDRRRLTARGRGDKFGAGGVATDHRIGLCRAKVWTESLIGRGDHALPRLHSPKRSRVSWLWRPVPFLPSRRRQ